MNRKIVSTALLLFVSFGIFAQGDHYDNSGKIYTVVAVVCITLIGIAAFLVYMERKIKILEKKINDEQRSN